MIIAKNKNRRTINSVMIFPSNDATWIKPQSAL